MSPAELRLKHATSKMVREMDLDQEILTRIESVSTIEELVCFIVCHSEQLGLDQIKTFRNTESFVSYFTYFFEE